MTLTTDMLRVWFRQFNADYFDDSLPMPRLALSKARTRLGTMSCKCHRRLTKRVYTDFCIRISIFYDCTEREYKETLLHEMIHYYITYNNIADTSAHGRVFHSMMNRLNNDHGWHITVSSSMRGHRPSDPQAQATSAYLVLAIVLKNGDRLLSVVSPRSARRVDTMARMADAIADHRWYMTHDSYFANFTRVRSLRAHRVDIALFDEKTAAMQPLAIR